jgi:hypothetical protein
MGLEFTIIPQVTSPVHVSRQQEAFGSLSYELGLQQNPATSLEEMGTKELLLRCLKRTEETLTYYEPGGPTCAHAA